MTRKALVVLALIFVPLLVIVGMIALEAGGINATNYNFVLAITLGASIPILASVGLFVLSYYDFGAKKGAGSEQDSDEP
jgi:hypothetical protein